MERMPIYEYDCAACGRRTEAIQNVGEKHLKVCPHCGGALKKAFSAPAIQFKGSGFYLTDYARGSGAGDSASGEGKSDSGEKAEKSEKAERSEKAEKSEKAAEASEKSAKSGKAEKPAKVEKPEKKKEKKAD
jgi:putative FmdB family regulatory protein